MKTTTLRTTGILLAVLAALLNGVFVRLEIGGLIRELARLGVLIGIGLFLFSFFVPRKKHKP